MVIHCEPILKPDQSYTFDGYFEMTYPEGGVLQELGASFEAPNRRKASRYE
ncbi:MAG: hypothetical protein AAFQ89_20750 [Cyanobacteria bacterium J06626_18]